MSHIVWLFGLVDGEVGVVVDVEAVAAVDGLGVVCGEVVCCEA